MIWKYLKVIVVIINYIDTRSHSNLTVQSKYLKFVQTHITNRIFVVIMNFNSC